MVMTLDHLNMSVPILLKCSVDINKSEKDSK
jgi:hypothetical protein